jgi:long-chain fatty acid transport protein
MNTVKQFKLKTLALAIAGASMTMPVLADEFHYRDILIGDRAAGLGGAYTAISDDASGLYYNPAGIVYSTSTKISGSVNAYNMKTTTYSGISASNPNQEWTRTSAGMVANFFGVVQPLGPGVAGFSIAIPNYELEDQTDNFTNLNAAKRLQNTTSFTQADIEKYGVNESGNFYADESDAITRQRIEYNNEDTTTLIGASYAMPITERLSFGATLYGYTRKKELTLIMDSKIKGTDPTDSNKVVYLDDVFIQKIQTNELGLQPRIGIMWSPVDKISIGLMAQTTFILSQNPESCVRSIRATPTQQYQITNVPNTSEGISTFNKLEDNENTGWICQTIDNKLPTEFNLGVAYFASNALLFSGDFSFATATDRYEATWNAAGGAEYFLNPTWAVRGGVYTNNANTHSNVSEYKNPHINEIGGTFSVTRYTKTSNITVGAGMLSGKGEANLFPNSSHTQDVKTLGVSFYVSTSASF